MVAGLSGAILAGGKSRRMGRDKSRLALGGETLVARTSRVIGALSDDVLIVTNTPEDYSELGTRLVRDAIPGGGALSGIHAALLAARHALVLVVACDMPFLNPDLLRYLAGLAAGYDVVVPRWRGESEPLHAIYARSCLPAIEPLLEQGGGRIVELYARVRTRHVEPEEIACFDPEGLSFFNVNSPEDWARAQELAARQG